MLDPKIMEFWRLENLGISNIFLLHPEFGVLFISLVEFWIDGLLFWLTFDSPFDQIENAETNFISVDFANEFEEMQLWIAVSRSITFFSNILLLTSWLNNLPTLNWPYFFCSIICAVSGFVQVFYIEHLTLYIFFVSFVLFESYSAVTIYRVQKLLRERRRLTIIIYDTDSEDDEDAGYFERRLYTHF